MIALAIQTVLGFMTHYLVRVNYLCHKQFSDRLALLKSNKADLVSHEYDVILVANLVKDLEITRRPYVLSDAVR